MMMFKSFFLRYIKCNILRIHLTCRELTQDQLKVKIYAFYRKVTLGNLKHPNQGLERDANEVMNLSKK